MKLKCLCLLLILTLILAGCGQSVSSFATFSIEGFEQFFDFHATEQSRLAYISDGKIDFAKHGDIYICPFIKETTHDECSLFFYVYASEGTTVDIVNISDIVLSANQGNYVVFNAPEGQSLALKKENGVLTGTLSGMNFKKEDEWFFNDNTLVLSFRATTDHEKEFSYDVNIICNYRANSPT